MITTRLRIVLIAFMLLLAGLFARAVQVQWRQRAYWVEQAQKRMETVKKIDTTRGRILDCKGRELAVDAPCIDAVVDYRVISNPPDEQWIKEYAKARLKTRLGSDYTKAPLAQRKQLLAEQTLQVKADIDAMWGVLGDQKLTGMTLDQIQERRQQIVRKVQMLRRYLWYAKFVKAEKQQEGKVSPWWQHWLVEENASEPQLDSFDVTVDEQFQSHVVLSAITTELANQLGKNVDRFPGLSIRPGLHRVYPYGEAACHVLGHLAGVSDDDLKSDAEKSDDLRKYLPTDEIGRQGIEGMCEQVLRGTRGRWKKEVGHDAVMDVEAQPGHDVRLAIDVELQKKIEAAFASPKLRSKTHRDPSCLHGAAIVIDVPTGEVRALVSYPTFDPNQFDQLYATLAADEVNKPLFNRATLSQLEPGSTVKPMVGMAGITEKVVGVHEGIECTGYFKIGSTVYKNMFRCWTMKQYNKGHHEVPVRHEGKYGNPDGFLIFADALERSCNVWPETVAYRLGFDRLIEWFGRFGLGRPTGIGIPEAIGRLPKLVRGRQLAMTLGAGTGQAVGATPIQMANVAATIARDGLWMRPRLVDQGFELPATRPSDDRVQLPIDPEAIREAKLGMRNVVNAPGATGTPLKRDDMVVAGKTGSAQAAKFSVIRRDAQGNPITTDGTKNGPKVRRFLEPSTDARENPEAPWYRDTGTTKPELSHAWFIGFAPADRPQIAFAVMVEYGGSGGGVAGPIAQIVLDAAVKEGYLAATPVKP